MCFVYLAIDRFRFGQRGLEDDIQDLALVIVKDRSQGIRLTEVLVQDANDL